MRLLKSLLAAFITAAIFASSAGASLAQPTAAPAPVAPAAPPPSSPVAVLDFRTEGLTSNWWGAWQPGVALSDLVTSNLVGAGYNVVDRTHLADVMREHALSSSGEVSDASLIQSGRMTGAKFLIVGNILQFAHTGTSGAGAGAFLPGILGAVASGIKTDRVTLKVEVRIVDATTGRILSSFNDEKTQSGTSWGVGGFSGGVAGGYGNSSFVNSTMGHLINDEAIAIVKMIDPTKLVAVVVPVLTGRVLLVDSGSVILNIGSASGVSVGTIFALSNLRKVKDPGSGELLTVEVPTGKISITSVNDKTAAGRILSGTAAAGAVAKSVQQ